MSDPVRIRRVLVLAGSYADAEAAIPLAVRLASLSRAEITGVLAEDPAALDLPGPAIATLAGGLVEITAERMLAAFRADARAFEARLGRAATQASLGWRFVHERGALHEVLWRLARRDDVMLVGYRRPLRLRGPVVALSEGGGGAVALAPALARAMRLPLLTLSVGDPQEHAAGSTQVSVPDMAAALRMLDTLAPTVLVLDGGASARATGPALRALIETARCPILLQNGAAG